MTPTSFEMTVSVSQDARLATAVRELVVRAAEYAGGRPGDAAQFARDVEAAVCASLEGSPPGTLLSVTVGRRAGPIEVIVDGQTLTFEV